MRAGRGCARARRPPPTARAPVRTGRREVGAHAPGPEGDRRDPVRAARHEVGLARLDRAGRGVRARVAALVDFETDDRAVATRVERNVEVQPAPLHGREVVAARLDVAHRTAESQRGRGRDHVGRDTADRLAAEAATDVGRDHAQASRTGRRASARAGLAVQCGACVDAYSVSRPSVLAAPRGWRAPPWAPPRPAGS